jgi:hypothetical protein
LLFALDGDPETYKEFAESYYECSIDLSVVQSIYEHQPMTVEMAKTLNPAVELENLRSELDEIGYPLG